jgi:hypothetical protein
MYWLWRNIFSKVLKLIPGVSNSIFFLELENKYDSIQLSKWEKKHESLVKFVKYYEAKHNITK